MTTTYDHGVQAEVSVLGAALVDAVALRDAIDGLKSTDFRLSSHQDIFGAICSLVEEGLSVEYTTVTEELKRNRKLPSVGGSAYLAFLMEGVPRNPSVSSYIRYIKDYSLLRRASAVMAEGVSRCNEKQEEARIIVTDIQGRLERISAEVTQDEELGDKIERFRIGLRQRRTGEAISFVPSGIDEYDATHSGFAKKEVTVIAARPGIGKSSIMRQSLIRNCTEGKFVHLFSPEMDDDAVLGFLASPVAEVPFRRVRHPQRMSEDELYAVENALDVIARWPFKLDTTSPLDPATMIARARRVKQRHDTQLMGLDYLQKMKFKGKPQDRHIAVTDAMVDLTSIAKTENIAIVVISSLTEPSGKERNRPPTKADLRQSGDIQYEAHNVILMHREIDSETHKPVPECNLIIDKARADEGGIKKVYFDSEYIQFVSQQAHLKGLGR